MYQIINIENNHRPVKSRFLTAAQAYRWAKKHLPKDSCSEWGKANYYRDKYYIKSY